MIILPAVASCVEITPFIGYGIGGQFEETVTDTTLELDESPLYGLILNLEAPQGGHYELFCSRQETTLTSGGIGTDSALFDMNIIPIINENDVVSTDDIELEDNYPLTRNVAYLSQANIIIIKSEKEGEYYIVVRGDKYAKHIVNEEDLIEKVEELISINKINDIGDKDFPTSINEIIFN